MDDIDEAVIVGLVRIGNHTAFVEALEPNVFYRGVDAIQRRGTEDARKG